MAETVGLVAGIVSLGIQVCQGLITYYCDYKDQGDEISNLGARLEALRDTLATIESLVNNYPRVQAQSSTQQIQASILSTYGGIIRLDAFLKKCRQATGDDSQAGSPAGLARLPIYADVKRGIKRQMSKAAYPFRKGTLKSLKETVADLQANLSTAMSALHLETSKIILDDTATIKTIAGNLPANIEDIDVRISALNDVLVRVSEGLPVLQMSVERIENTMELSLPALQSSICKIAEDIPALESRLVVKANLCLGTDAGSARQPQGNDLEALAGNVRDLQLNLSERPSLLKSALDDRIRGTFSSAVGLPFGSPDSSLAWCYCGPGVLDTCQREHHRHGILLYRSMKTTRHLPGCPFQSYSRTQMVFGVNLLFCNYLLKGLLQASMSMTTGAGGYSISPNLTFRTTASWTSPAFDIINKISLGPWEDEAGNPIKPSQKLQRALKELQKVFSDRTASPADVTNTHGDTILHAACKIWNDYQMRYFLRDPAGLIEYRRLILYLCKAIKAVGISMNETNLEGNTPFELLLDRLFIMTRCNADILLLSGSMITEGAEIFEEHFRRSRTICVKNPCDIIHADINRAEYLVRARLSIDSHETSSLESRLTAAVVSRNLGDVEQILRDMDTRNINLDSLGYSPLHRAVGWPEGVLKLINATPHLMNLPTWPAGELPIHCACYHGHYEATKLLLEHNSNLRSSENHALLYAVRSNDEKIIDLIVKALADCGMRLYELARLYLPREKVLQITSDRIPDADAHFIINELSAVSIHIPEVLDRRGFFDGWRKGTVYHVLFNGCGRNLITTAQKLYDAGFLDVDAPNDRGCTPLMFPWQESHLGAADNAAIADWLISKGADMGKLLLDDSPNKTGTGAAVIHFLAGRMGFALFRPLWLPRSDQDRRMLDELFIPDSMLSGVFCHIAFSRTVDECLCPCSLNGCLPLTIFLRCLLGRKQGPKWKARLLLFVDWMSKHLVEQISRMIASGVAPDVAQEFQAQYYSSIIRFLSFETLGIMHTCCHMNRVDHFGRPPYATRDISFTRRSCDEVTEITEEYQHIIGVLESLVSEFDAAIQSQFDISLFELVRRHWAPRISEELRKLTEEWSNSLAAERCTEIGIVWQHQEHEDDREWPDELFGDILAQWLITWPDDLIDDVWVWVYDDSSVF